MWVLPICEGNEKFKRIMAISWDAVVGRLDKTGCFDNGGMVEDAALWTTGGLPFRLRLALV